MNKITLLFAIFFCPCLTFNSWAMEIPVFEESNEQTAIFEEEADQDEPTDLYKESQERREITKIKNYLETIKQLSDTIRQQSKNYEKSATKTIDYHFMEVAQNFTEIVPEYLSTVGKLIEQQDFPEKQRARINKKISAINSMIYEKTDNVTRGCLNPLDWWKQLKKMFLTANDDFEITKTQQNPMLPNKSGRWFYNNEKGIPVLWNHPLEPNQICHSLMDLAMLMAEIDKILLPMLAKKNTWLANATRSALIGIPVIFLLFVVGMNGTGMTGVKTEDQKLAILSWLWNIYQATRA